MSEYDDLISLARRAGTREDFEMLVRKCLRRGIGMADTSKESYRLCDDNKKVIEARSLGACPEEGHIFQGDDPTLLHSFPEEEEPDRNLQAMVKRIQAGNRAEQAFTLHEIKAMWGDKAATLDRADPEETLWESLDA